MLMFAFTIVSASSSLNIHVRPLTAGVYQPNTQFNYTFNFTTSNACTGVLLSRNAIINTDGYGIGYATIDISNLNGTPTYMCEYKNGVLRETHTLGSGLFNNMHVTNDLKVGNNINATGNVTATYFKGDGSLLTGITSLWANNSGNATYIDGNVGIGTTNPNETLSIIGNIEFTGNITNNVNKTRGVHICPDGTIIIGDLSLIETEC